jgi:hypothetical protein
MTRTAIVRILLSLLLLISQQMAASHMLTHLSGGRDRVAASVQNVPGRDSVSDAFAQDQSCSQCLAFAQLAGPLPSTPPAFVVPSQQSKAVDGVDVHDAGARIILAFQSRAPPVLS